MQVKQFTTTNYSENILPLVNVVFLLLIFFMLAGAFSKPDLFEVIVPSAENDNAADRKVLTILMNENGEIALDQSILSEEELIKMISNELGGSSLVQLQLKADANMNATRLIDVMDLLSNTDLASIHLLTVAPGSVQ